MSSTGLVQEPPLDPREKRKRRREGLIIALLGLVFVGLMVAEFRLTKVSSSLPFVNSIFFFGLLNVNIIILIALIWLVFRNIGKLFLERRRKVLGSSLKTKLVVSFLAFSIIPTLVLFVISAAYINTSFDKWFSIKIQNTLQASLEITHTYYRNTERTAMHFAEHLAGSIPKHAGKDLAAYLENERSLLALDAVEYYADPLGRRMLSRRAAGEDQAPEYPRLPLDILDRAFSGESVPVVQHIGSGDLIRCLAPVKASGQVVGAVVVSAYIPVSLVNKVDEIANVFDDYRETNPLKYPVKTTYFVILVMITLVILFVAIWIGLYLARELTVPVERLVRGAQAVGSGDLDVKIGSTGHDEIAVLVDSFNKMTADLKDNRARLMHTSADLERRRIQLEAILANIGTGVIAIDAEGRVTNFNRAATAILETEVGEVLNKHYAEVLTGESRPLAELILQTLEIAPQRAVSGGRIEAQASQWNHRGADGTSRMLSAVASPLKESSTRWGAVIVIDDMTHLIKGQREMAWREVARRIAHEIKNPLTPIKLSAQRLQRRLGDYGGRDGSLLQECTDTIIRHTDELKEMVNEFSNFARFPEVSPAPNSLNKIIQETLQLYQQAHAEIEFKVSLHAQVPIFEFDRDQVKRVLINLVDNAVAALGEAPASRPRIVSISTHFNEQLQMAMVEVADNGLGMTDEVKGRVFEPYFSTKSGGTGLGLAIAKRIINDHDGFIRVYSTEGEGTKFLIELPTALRAPERREMPMPGGHV